MLRLELLDEVGGLRVVRVRREGDVVDGEVDGHSVAGRGGDLLRLRLQMVRKRAID